MSIGQQWAAIFVIFWIASVWYAYSLGEIRGQIKELKWVRGQRGKERYYGANATSQPKQPSLATRWVS